jgi:hypothetical protein
MNIVQQANKYARNRARRIGQIIKRDNKRVATICKVLQKAGVNVTDVGVDSSSYNISITGPRADLDVMFGILRRLGLQPTSRPQEKTQYFSTYWTFEDTTDYIFVMFSSTSCKRVQVGTKMEEVPVYDTVCEE